MPSGLRPERLMRRATHRQENPFGALRYRMCPGDCFLRESQCETSMYVRPAPPQSLTALASRIKSQISGLRFLAYMACSPGGVPALVRVAGQDAVELAAGADAELGEDLAQVVLDRARADEQSRADLRVGKTLAGQPRDLGLLGGQRITGLAGSRSGGLRGALADGLAGGQQLAAGALGEPAGPCRIKQLVGGAE